MCVVVKPQCGKTIKVAASTYIRLVEVAGPSPGRRAEDALLDAIKREEMRSWVPTIQLLF